MVRQVTHRDLGFRQSIALAYAAGYDDPGRKSATMQNDRVV